MIDVIFSSGSSELNVLYSFNTLSKKWLRPCLRKWPFLGSDFLNTAPHYLFSHGKFAKFFKVPHLENLSYLTCRFLESRVFCGPPRLDILLSRKWINYFRNLLRDLVDAHKCPWLA